jgi:hypothetical protein
MRIVSVLDVVLAVCTVIGGVAGYVQLRAYFTGRRQLEPSLAASRAGTRSEPVRLSWHTSTEYTGTGSEEYYELEVFNQSGRTLTIEAVGMVFDCDGTERVELAEIWRPERAPTVRLEDHDVARAIIHVGSLEDDYIGYERISEKYAFGDVAGFGRFRQAERSPSRVVELQASAA